MSIKNPFDEVVAGMRSRGFHNHRTEDHSDTVSLGILRDLRRECRQLREDFDNGKVRHWLNATSPGGRARKLDLVVAEADGTGNSPDMRRVRICLENKSVITAHRNRTNRFDDLDDVRKVLYPLKPDAILVATVLVGVAERVLNVPDRVKPFAQDFETRVLPRLSSGDAGLWKEFPHAVSKNRPGDAERTVKKFRELPVRPPGMTHIEAYDWVLLVPVFVDNVNAPFVARENNLGIDVDKEYQAMLASTSKAYFARWHL